MKIKVAQNIQFKKNTKHIVISICDDKTFFTPIPKNNCFGALQLEVIDWDGPYLRHLFYKGRRVPKNKIFNEHHAKQILNFVNKNLNKIDLIISHCDNEMSRSSAVAAALSRILNGHEKPFFSFPYRPNYLIYRRLLNEYYNK